MSFLCFVERDLRASTAHNATLTKSERNRGKSTSNKMLRSTFVCTFACLWLYFCVTRLQQTHFHLRNDFFFSFFHFIRNFSSSLHIGHCLFAVCIVENYIRQVLFDVDSTEFRFYFCHQPTMLAFREAEKSKPTNDEMIFASFAQSISILIKSNDIREIFETVVVDSTSTISTAKKLIRQNGNGGISSENVRLSSLFE